MKIKVVSERADDGRYYLYVPALPGVIADAATRKEAESRLRDEIASYLTPHDDDLPVVDGRIEEILL